MPPPMMFSFGHRGGTTAVTPMACTPQREAQLEAAVHAVCDLQRACTGADGCGDLETKIMRNVGCYDARTQMMNECYDGGDGTHLDQRQAVLTTRAECQRRYIRVRQCPMSPAFSAWWQAHRGG